MTWTIPNIKVLKVEERKTSLWVGGVGSDAVFKEKSLGWFVQLEGSYESLYLGQEKPDLQINDTVDIIISRHERTVL